jgi:hypothetical protein
MNQSSLTSAQVFDKLNSENKECGEEPGAGVHFITPAFIPNPIHAQSP